MCVCVYNNIWLGLHPSYAIHIAHVYDFQVLQARGYIYHIINVSDVIENRLSRNRLTAYDNTDHYTAPHPILIIYF